jgi:nucleotidyltransferase substrate binding protein (TIGR01987 family)
VPLDIAPLVNVIDRLREGLARHQSEPADDQLRDGLIQRFEFTYELRHRTLKRFIRQAAASPEEVDRMAFQDLIRTANQQGLLLGDWPAWHRYRDARAWVFGSPASGTARRYSDLDLALEGEKPLNSGLLANIAEALSQSDLAYKTDIIDLHAVDPDFRAIVERDMIALPF